MPTGELIAECTYFMPAQAPADFAKPCHLVSDDCAGSLKRQHLERIERAPKTFSV